MSNDGDGGGGVGDGTMDDVAPSVRDTIRRGRLVYGSLVRARG